MKIIKRLLCKQHEFVRVVYGYPSPLSYKEAEEGKIILGGCIVPDDNLHFLCRKCGKEIVFKRIK